jgi:hypothetical protein
MNSKKKILFITSNDGTDMRIFKEVKTLSKEFEIYFVGVNQSNITDSFVKDYCKKDYFVIGKRKSILTIFKQYIYIIRLLLKFKFNSIHVINEQLLIFFLPILWSQKVILDIFDSIFLVNNLPNRKALFFKWLIYSNCFRIIVTDANRKMILPDFVIKKTIVLENYPFKIIDYPEKNEKTDKIKIMYYGWLGEKRGSKIIKELLSASTEIEVYMAGWIIDEFTKEIINHPQVKYLGVMKQKDANEFVYKNIDYILAIYEPSNQNNFFASPNKVFDAIHCEVPLIINAEVNISNFVKAKNIGYVLSSYYKINYEEVITDLKNKRYSYSFNDELKDKYSWNSIEEKLLQVHIF